jgi:hypothetical protein
MAATLEASYSLSTNATFRARVRSAIAIAAKDVFGETSSGIPSKDQKRRDLAFGVLNSVDSYVERFATLVAVNPSVTSSASDGDIQFTVNSLWDDVAGYDPNQG